MIRFSTSKTWAIAENTFREAVRKRLFSLLALAGISSFGFALYFQEFNLGESELRFIADFGFGGMTLLGSLMAIVISSQLLYGEFEHKTILPLLSKPVGRSEFLIGKLIGVWLTLCSLIAILTLSLVIALWIRATQLNLVSPDGLAGSPIDYRSIVAFSVLQCFRLLILSSVTILFASYATSQMFAYSMGFFFWLIGQLQGSVFGGVGSGMTIWIRSAAQLIAPDLRLFDLGNTVIEGQALPFSTVAGLVVYALVYATLYLALARWAIKHREF